MRQLRTAESGRTGSRRLRCAPPWPGAAPGSALEGPPGARRASTRSGALLVLSGVLDTSAPPNSAATGIGGLTDMNSQRSGRDPGSLLAYDRCMRHGCFTHLCGKTRNGRFWLRRITIKKRMRAKLKQLKVELRRRRHWPIPEQGGWLASVVRGHLNYYAVPGNIDAVTAFRDQVRRHWFETLRRRSQRHRMTWDRYDRIAATWLPPARIVRPYPSAALAARTRGRSPVR